MRTVAIIQARMNSTRLPGKILADLCGRPMLAQQLQRLRTCQLLDEIVVATTTSTLDDDVAALAKSEAVACVRGSEHDVLDRFCVAAASSDADLVVRLTADCPLIDARVVDRTVCGLTEEPVDYASNVIERTYPRGLDVEVFFSDTLYRAARLAKSKTAREHVTSFIYAERPDLFILRSIVDVSDNSDLRWTVDTTSDLEMVRTLYAKLGIADRDISYQELLSFVRAHPEIPKMNDAEYTWTPNR